MDVFSAPHFRDDNAAREFLESLLWPDGPICPHCGDCGTHAYKTKRPGVYRCAEKECRKDFSVTKGTVMERSKIALHKWLQAFHMMAASKKGVSAHQLHRSLGITYEAAWFLEHRIREAMRDGGLDPLGGAGKAVEADETYYGPIEQAAHPSQQGPSLQVTKKGRGPANKRPIVALVERGGRVRTFYAGVADKADCDARSSARTSTARAACMTDESPRLYTGSDEHFASHETVKHSAGEYVRGDVHTNSAEGYFSIFKRGMRGVYQHCREKHLHRYLAEFDFRYNHRVRLGFNDTDRASMLRSAEPQASG